MTLPSEPDLAVLRNVCRHRDIAGDDATKEWACVRCGAPFALALPGEALRTALWQCGVESGMDTDGDTGPGAMIAGMGDAGFAAAMIEQVRQLRRDYDECLSATTETTDHE